MQTHIYSCQNSATQEIREGAIATLQQALQTAGTPQQLSTLLTDMLQSSTPPPTVDPTSQAIVTPQLQIGWHGLHRGHLSKKWRNAYLASLSTNSKHQSELAHTWGKKVIQALWKYSLTLWEVRNSIIHGKTALQVESKKIQLLRKQASEYYSAYNSDPHSIPASRAFLFDKPLQITLQLPSQQLQCWLSTVKEALETKSHRDAISATSQRETLKCFLIPHGKPTAAAPSPPTMSPQTAKRPPQPSKRHRLVTRKPYRATFKPRCLPAETQELTQDAHLFQPAFKRTVTPASPIRSSQEITGSTQHLPTPRGPFPPRRKRANIQQPAPNAKPGRAAQPPIKDAPTRRPRKALSQDTLADPAQGRLAAYGFLPRLQKSQIDCEAAKIDYSGSLHSTAP
jgi:hypothetical protein